MLLLATIYFAYRYAVYPTEQDEALEASNRTWASLDTSNREFNELMRQQGRYTLSQAESSRAAFSDRMERAMLASTLHNVNDDTRDWFLSGGVTSALILLVVSWVWFGGAKERQATSA